MLTYNQEEFIAQAIEGVLMQETDFDYQLVIGEDCSTDRTREICKEYARNHPDKIKLLLNKENLGLGANYVKTYAECTGKYVAICDGDDYWIDSLKLQKQVDFLEDNPAYNIVYTNNYNLFPNGQQTGPKKDKRKIITSFSELVQGNYIASVTVLFKRKSLTKEMEKLVRKIPYGDWPTYLLVLAESGKIFYIDEPTAVYRKDIGASTQLRKKKSKMGEIRLSILEKLSEDDVFMDRKACIRRSILRHKTGLMASYNKEKKFFKSLFLLGALCLKRPPVKMIRLHFYSLKRSLF